jgi:hypothetical protein
VTKPNSVYIDVLLDRSGSMQAIRSDMIEGFNRFLAEQKLMPGDCRITLVQFDSEGYDIVYRSCPIEKAPPLTEQTFEPRASTPLIDSMMRAIDGLGFELKTMVESERPSKVIFMTITDGKENASHLHTAAELRAKVKHQEEKYGWSFIFLGANQDAIKEGDKYGYRATRAMDWAPTKKGIGETYAVMSSNVGAFRSTGDDAALNFTPEQRLRAKAGETGGAK